MSSHRYTPPQVSNRQLQQIVYYFSSFLRLVLRNRHQINYTVSSLGIEPYVKYDLLYYHNQHALRVNGMEDLFKKRWLLY